MLRWPIRLKLMVGLSLVVGMMLILMGGSTFGLHSFHISNLTLSDQLRGDRGVHRALRLGLPLACTARRTRPSVEKSDLKRRVLEARGTCRVYHRELKKNTSQGNRADSGRDELVLALSMDDDLTAILNEIDAEHAPFEPLVPRHHALCATSLPKLKSATGLKSRIDRLYETVSKLPGPAAPGLLRRVLQMSKGQYQTSRIIVWSSAIMVLGMLCGLTRPVSPLGPLAGADAPAGRPSRGAGLLRLQDQPEDRATRCRIWPRRSTT